MNKDDFVHPRVKKDHLWLKYKDGTIYYYEIHNDLKTCIGLSLRRSNFVKKILQIFKKSCSTVPPEAKNCSKVAQNSSRCFSYLLQEIVDYPLKEPFFTVP